VTLGHPARGDALALADLVLDSDAQVAVAEDELVEAERAPDAVVPVVLAGVDVIVKAGAVDADGQGGVAARADLFERVPSQVCSVASGHRPEPFRAP
jgi:hypothetical protein